MAMPAAGGVLVVRACDIAVHRAVGIAGRVVGVLGVMVVPGIQRRPCISGLRLGNGVQPCMIGSIMMVKIIVPRSMVPRSMVAGNMGAATRVRLVDVWRIGARRHRRLGGGGVRVVMQRPPEPLRRNRKALGRERDCQQQRHRTQRVTARAPPVRQEPPHYNIATTAMGMRIEHG